MNDNKLIFSQYLFYRTPDKLVERNFEMINANGMTVLVRKDGR